MIRQVAANNGNAQLVEQRRVAVGPGDGRDDVASGGTSLGNMTSDKSCCTRNQYASRHRAIQKQ
jgi:hypothetical protein